MNLQTEIDLLQIKIKSNIEANEAEKLYYQTLALTELRKNHLSPSTNENPILLTPIDLTTDVAGLYSSPLVTANPVWDFFGDAGSNGVFKGSTGWVGVDFDSLLGVGKKAHVTRWCFTSTNSATSSTVSHPKDVVIEVSDAINPGTGDWQLVDERLGIADNSSKATRFYDVANPLTARHCRFRVAGVYGSGDLHMWLISFYGQIIEV